MWALIGLLALPVAHAGDRGRCQQAMTHDTIRAWAAYAERFPQGRCVELAYQRMDELRLDAEACHTARIDNTLEAWADYARRYPTGACGVEAASELLARRHRGGVLQVEAPPVPPPPPRASADDLPTVTVRVSPDLGEGWEADLTSLARALSECDLGSDLQIVMKVGPTGPGAATLEGALDNEGGMCALAAFRQHRWPRPSDEALLTATVLK